MTSVAARLGARRIDVSAARVDPAEGVRLAELRPGASAQVLDIDGSVEPATARRLFDLGFAPGSVVTVLRRAPLGDPVVFHVAEAEVALRRVQAAGIRVQLIS